MRNPKLVVLGTVFALLLGLVVWQWISSWGLITCNFKDAPLAKVVKLFESQGGVRIVTNADLTKPVTLTLSRVPLADALDTLAVRLDGDSRLAIVGAPNAKQIKEVFEAFAANNNPGGWAVFSAGWGGGGPGGGAMLGDTAVDPRKIAWKVSDSPDKSLQAILNQGAQKTGSLFAVPKDWNPVLGSLPGSGTASKVARALFSKANGTSEEVFLLTVRQGGGEGRRPERTVFSPAWDGRRGGGGPAGNNGNGGPNQEWVQERIQSQIALLPPEEQAEAKKQVDEMKALFDSIRALPEDQRRAKFEEVMNRPDVQEKMQDRMDARDSKRTPEQREQRYRNYIDRKQAAGAPGTAAKS